VAVAVAVALLAFAVAVAGAAAAAAAVAGFAARVSGGIGSSEAIELPLGPHEKRPRERM
jgi:hypothetical protein